MELHRLAGDPGAGLGLDVALGEVAGVGAEAEQPGQARLGSHRDQVAAAVHPRAERAELRVVDARAGEHDDLVGRQSCRRQSAGVADREGVEPLRAEDLGVVAAERVARIGDHEDGPSRPLAGRGLRRRSRREGSGEEQGGYDGADETLKDATHEDLNGPTAAALARQFVRSQ